MLRKMEIHEVTEADFESWLNLAKQLWPTSPSNELEWILQNMLRADHETGVIVRLENGTPVAFMNLSLRFDYVVGATQRPTAYIEGIYVVNTHRRKGVARRLVEYAEHWAVDHGCSQLASDAVLENIESQSFHRSVGFREVARTVAYIKDVTGHP